MSVVNLIVAFALMGGLWVAVVKALAASIRRTYRAAAGALRPPVTQPMPSPPANRLVPVRPNATGAANSRTVVSRPTMKDSPA